MRWFGLCLFENLGAILFLMTARRFLTLLDYRVSNNCSFVTQIYPWINPRGIVGNL